MRNVPLQLEKLHCAKPIVNLFFCFVLLSSFFFYKTNSEMFAYSFKNYIRVKPTQHPNIVLFCWCGCYCGVKPFQISVLNLGLFLLTPPASTLLVPRVVKKQDLFLRDYWISLQYLLCHFICKSNTWIFLILFQYFFCMDVKCRHLGKMKRSWRLVEAMGTGL